MFNWKAATIILKICTVQRVVYDCGLFKYKDYGGG